MRISKGKHPFLFYCFLCIISGLISCNQMDLDGPTGEFMLVNMNTSLEDPVTFSFNGMKANASAIGYGSNSGYISIKNGNYDLELLDPEEAVLFQKAAISIGSGSYYTFLMFGQEELKTVLLKDQYHSSQQAQVRFLNFVETLPQLSLVSVTDSSIHPLFEDRAAESAQTAEEHGKFEVRDTGTVSITLMEEVPDETTFPQEPSDPEPSEDPENPEDPEEPVDRGFLLAPQQINMQAGMFYTIIASGQPGSAEYPLKLTVITK